MPRGFLDEAQKMTVDLIGDYPDSYKNKVWQDSAAASSAKFVKEFAAQLPEDQKDMTVVDALSNSSAHQENTLETRQAESALESRARLNKLGSNWRQSIVDLLVLLDVDPGIRIRSRLAELLNVHGPLGSNQHNISLHQAVLQELARNNGDLSKETRSELAGLQGPASKEELYSDGSEVESIFSDDTIASSQSSSSQTANPALELAYLLLRNDTLSPLFGIALAKYNISRVNKKLISLLSCYGRGLEREASGDAQRVVAGFIQQAARQIAILLTRAMASESKSTFVSNRKELSKLLEARSDHRETSAISVLNDSNHPEEHLSEIEEDQSEQSESQSGLSLEILREVEQYMVESRAFTTLVASIRKWLGLFDNNIDDIMRNTLDMNSVESSEASISLPAPDMSPQHPRLDAAEKEANSSFLHRASYKLTLFEPIFWPRTPEGFTRITWKSPLGRLLHIDVRERKGGAAKRLQERFRASARKWTLGPPSSSSSSGALRTVTNSIFAATPQAPPAAHLMIGSFNQSTVPYYTSRGHSLCNSTLSPAVPHNIRQADQKYLLICFSTSKSEIFKQIDITTFGNDQTLFDNLHRVYHAIRREESWFIKIPLLRSQKVPSWLSWCLGDLHLYKPRKINFVSFHLMPLGGIPTPLNIKAPSIPPEREVHIKNWHYSPCPSEIEEWDISEAFATKLLEPGHAFLDAEWLELFPKKLRSSFIYGPGKKSTLWGIHIVEGLNKAAVVWIAILVMLSSALVGLIYSVASHDVSAAFTLAAWFATSASLFVPYLQFK
ncbi:hypothetical protein N7450_011456 [Penicillium hetheringtonii]|uniref:DUF3597 domain-containing protein n=1 Tax=Penicillium hetheringtonii TaxID=911720 RepID=A0AAD6GNB2_9EURO|nr:hypothetical protein N7450_011456 [Penicillium hetheringtonii]